MATRVTKLPGMAALEHGLNEGVVALAEAVIHHAEARKPKRSVATIERRPAGPGKISVEVHWSDPAILAEFGTRAHDIAPKTKSALKLGEKGFAARAKHPGGKARPFMSPAFMAVQAQADPLLAAGIARSYK